MIICSRKQKNVDEALEKLKGLKVEGFACNVDQSEQRQKIVDYITKKYGRLDVLVPNAASSTHMGP